MDYYSGSASSVTELRSAMVNSLVSSGYIVTGDNVTKAGTPLDLSIVVTDTAPGNQRIVLSARRGGVLCSKSYKMFQPISTNSVKFDWPITWEAFVYDDPDEFYFVVRYQSDYYQTFAFGNSPYPGISECVWFSGPAESTAYELNDAASLCEVIINRTSFSSGQINVMQCGLMSPCGCFFNPLENTWVTISNENQSGIAYYRGQVYMASLIAQTPSPYTSAPILLPIKILANRSSGVGNQTFTGFLNNARLIRLDNHQSLDVLTLGAETWKLYPFYRRDSNARNGGYNLLHSGTLGFALRTN